MSNPDAARLFVAENTRRLTVELADGVTPERFLELLNKRHVKIDGEKLTDGYTGEVLGRRVSSVNSADYRAAADQTPLPALDAIDLYDFNHARL